MKCSSTSKVVLQISIGSPLLQRIFVMHSGSPRIATIARVVQIGPSTGPSLGGEGLRGLQAPRNLEAQKSEKKKKNIYYSGLLQEVIPISMLPCLDFCKIESISGCH